MRGADFGRRAAQVVLLALAAWVAALAVESLFWPMGFDQGVFAWVGDVILGGGVPYRDAWEIKGPAGYYTYAASQALFGRGFWGIRLLDLAALAATLVALWRLLRWRAGMPGTALGVLLLAAVHLAHGYWNTAQPDGWGSMLILIALAVLVGGDDPVRRGISGALAGLAILYKPTFAASTLPLVAYLLLAPAAGRRDRARGLVPFAIGVTGVLGLGATALAVSGAWPAFVDIQLGFNTSVHGGLQRRPLADHAAALSAYLLQPLFLALALLGALGAVRSYRSQRPMAVALVLLVFAAIASVAVQDKYYPYHWLPVYGPLVALAAEGFAALQGLVRRFTMIRGDRLGLAWLVPTLAGVGVVAPTLLAADLSGWRTFVFRTATPAEHWSRFATARRGGFSASVELAVADHLRAHTDPGEALFVWGLEPLVYFLADRPPATRFGYSYPLVAGAETPRRARYRAELLRDLRARTPAYVVIHHLAPGQNNLTPQPTEQQLREFPELLAWLRANYSVETRIQNFQLWRAESPAPAPGSSRHDRPQRSKHASAARASSS